MFRGLLLTFTITLLSVLYPIQLDWLLGVEAQEDAVFNFLIQMEKQKIKLRILKELGITEDSLLSDSLSPSRPGLSPDVLKMLLSKYENGLSIEENDNIPKLMISPENDDFECEWSDEPSCRRFEYKLSPKAEIASSEFWFRKLQSSPGDNLTISVLCSDSEKILIKKTDQMFSDQEAEKKWDIYQLSALRKLTSRKGEVACEIETSGIAVDDRKPNRPFLKMNEERVKRQRKRQNEDSTGRHSNCKSIPFNFSFEAMGFGHIVVHPLWFMANICEGYCDHSQSQYETLMDMYFRHHPHLETSYSRCWATCCRPTEYQNMMFIYINENNTQIIRNITKAIATRCACA